MTTQQQQQMLVELAGLRDQIEKGHFLNVHFRAFQLAHAAWMEHVRQNAACEDEPTGAIDRAGPRLRPCRTCGIHHAAEAGCKFRLR